MTSQSLIILGLFISLPSTIALYLTTAMGVYDTAQVTTTDLSWHRRRVWHQRHHLRNVSSFWKIVRDSWQRACGSAELIFIFTYILGMQVHGFLNMIGWGTLLPLGAIIARYFRKFPMECSEWFSLHVLCQALGYLLGSLGWAIGIWLGNSSFNYTFHTHRVLGIIIFTFSTLQVIN